MFENYNLGIFFNNNNMSYKMRSFKDCKETIHSGQFMVSHIEGQEDDALEEDDDNPSITSPLGSDVIPYIEYTNASNEVEKYNPYRNIKMSSDKTVSHVEIDTDLSTVFNTLNVTYRQKLTSPKWNPFKGIRLRWKDKIRLNNVIWRCWHMQFIMKKRLFVCQFASPLDVDIHNTPQAILLEGKYWKRKLGVIKAEYTKWRKYNVHRSGATNIVDTTSELDFLEWSPNGSENLLAISDNMTTDTLFSTLTQYPFPDSREIARGAGRADFIQPSLGPLQPNLDDLMDLDLDFLNNFSSTRLAPVPEEAPEEILKAIEYPLMGSEQMNSQNLQQMSTGNVRQQQQQQQQQNILMNVNSTIEPTLQYNTAKVYTQTSNCLPIENTQSVIQQVGSTSSAQTQQQQMNRMIDSYMNNQQQQQQHQQISYDDTIVKDEFGKNKYSRGLMKIGRREPHNYDKVQNTPHQTNIYNQLIAQKQLPNPLITQSSASAAPQAVYTPTYMTNEMMQQQQQMRASPIQTTTNNYTNVLNLSNSSNESMQQQMNNAKMMNNSTLNQMQLQRLLSSSPQQQQQQQQQQHMLNPMNAQQPDMTASLQQHQQVQQQQESYKISTHQTHSPLSPSYKSYHSHQTPYKIPSQNSGYVGSQRSRHQSPPHNTNLLSIDQQMQAKEIYRSNSLPINATIQLPQKDEGFVVPKYQAKCNNNRLRSRSNSMIMKQSQAGTLFQPGILHTAASEPVLNSTASSSSALLAQLLTTNNPTKLLSEHSLSSGNLSMKNSLPQYSSYSMPNPVQASAQQNSSASHNPPQHHQKHSKSLPQHLIAGTVINQNLTHQSSTGSSSSTSSAASTSNQTAILSNFSPTNNTVPNTVLTPCVSPDSGGDSPVSPRSGGSGNSRDLRRSGHIHAEQKRRYNIKNGFDMLHSLIPQLQNSPNAKLSKAALLQKGAEYIKQLRNERSANTEIMEKLKKEKEALNSSLNHLHTVLPANGAPLSREKAGKIKEMYTDYVHFRSRENWKFWIFGTIFEPLMNSFNQTVSVANMDELCRTTQLWVDQHCSLVELRPAVSNKLRQLSTTTDILSVPPTTLQEEAEKAIVKYENKKKA